MKSSFASSEYRARKSPGSASPCGFHRAATTCRRGSLLHDFRAHFANLRAAIRQLPLVLIFDNDDLKRPYRLVAIFGDGRLVRRKKHLPKWLTNVLSKI